MSTADSFIPELESMDLTSLHGKTFCVAISTGDRDGMNLLPSTIRGPFEFCGMVEYVYDLWNSRLDHAKVMVLSKALSDKAQILDAKTIDYIISKAPDILLEEMLLKSPEPYTCAAGIVTEEVKEKVSEKV